MVIFIQVSLDVSEKVFVKNRTYANFMFVLRLFYYYYKSR